MYRMKFQLVILYQDFLGSNYNPVKSKKLEKLSTKKLKYLKNPKITKHKKILKKRYFFLIDSLEVLNLSTAIKINVC